MCLCIYTIVCILVQLIHVHVHTFIYDDYTPGILGLRELDDLSDSNVNVL